MENRYNSIIYNKTYKELLEKLSVLESERIFCRHGIEHLLDVCRLAYINVLENGLNIPKDIVYAAGLLHDIGRVAEYEGYGEHHENGAKTASEIMAECGYACDEIEMVADAIVSHRSLDDTNVTSLKNILYKADKESRNCFYCSAYDLCRWDENKKNRGVN